MSAHERIEIERELDALAKLMARGGAVDLPIALRARLEQIEKYGHDEDADDDRPPLHLANVLLDLARAGRDVLHPGERHNLDVAYRRAGKVAATALALMRRIRTEKERAIG